MGEHQELVSDAFMKLLEVGMATESNDGPSLNLESAKNRLLELNPYDLSITQDALRNIVEHAPCTTAGPVAMMIGCAVERGFSPAIGASVIAPGTIRALRRSNAFLKACEDISSKKILQASQEESDSTDIVEKYGDLAKIESPEDGEFFGELRNFCLPLIAALSRSKELRKDFEFKTLMIELSEELKYLADGPGFLINILKTLDDEDLLVFDPSAGLGFRFSISGIADNYQLHILLADALIRKWPEGVITGQRPHPKLVAAHVDQDVDPAHRHAIGSFDLLNWTVLTRAGFLPPTSLKRTVGFVQARLPHMISGEGVPSDIQSFEGTRVVLIANPSIERHWNACRVFSGMVPELKLVEVLPRLKVRLILESMGARASQLQA